MIETPSTPVLARSPASPRLRIMNRVGNPLMRTVLRSPLHGICDKALLLLTYRGMRSGQFYTLPVEYAEDGADLFVVVGTPNEKVWWRNLRDGQMVTLLLRGASTQRYARVVSDDHAMLLRGLSAYLTRFPAAAAHEGITRHPDGTFDRDSLERSATQAVVIRLTPLEPAA